MTSPVVVSRGWGGVTIEVEEDHLSGFHMTDAAGGTTARLPRPVVAAYMLCSMIPDDSWSSFGHSCRHGPPPHRIKVIVPRKHNAPDVYARARTLAETRSARQSRDS